jgi:hypothetical protein
MPLTHYSKFSMITLRIWVFKSGVLKNLFILSKHGMKANIRSTKMANNRHAYNRDVLQSYWMSDGLPLHCSQPTGEKTHTNQQCEKLATIRQTTGNIWSWRRYCRVWLDGCHLQPVPYSNNTGCPIDVCQQEQLETVWNQRDLSQGRPTSTITFVMVLSTTWLEFKDRRKIHWLDESQFLLHVTDGRMRVWRHKNTA